MHTIVLIQASILLYLSSQSVTQFLPPSMFQRPPGLPGFPGFSGSNTAGSMMMPPMPHLQMPAYPQQRLPVMMMPYHSKAADKEFNKRKKRRPKYYDLESSSYSESCSSGEEYLKSKRRQKKRRQVLTPVISYVTRNGRVIYQKKIKKENAGDWLELGKEKVLSKFEEGEKESGEMTISDLKYKYGLKKRHHHNHNK